MRGFRGTASARVAAPADVVFDAITDVERLPEWNEAIECVLSRPDVLRPGEQWLVRMHPPRGPRWPSRSTVRVIDREAGAFGYRTQHANGNPSFVLWDWQLTPAGEETEVRVSWDCTLNTVDRRWFGGPIRRRQLAREVPRSLAALALSIPAMDRRPRP
jgi:uncharacterized protein YndB with AHSA1/START domain